MARTATSFDYAGKFYLSADYTDDKSLPGRIQLLRTRSKISLQFWELSRLSDKA
jgi:hypothetical protein